MGQRGEHSIRLWACSPASSRSSSSAPKDCISAPDTWKLWWVRFYRLVALGRGLDWAEKLTRKNIDGATEFWLSGSLAASSGIDWPKTERRDNQSA